MSMGNSAAEFAQAATQWQKMMTDSWGQYTKNMVSSESFAAASGAYMDWTLSTQKVMTEMSGQVMEGLDIPRRSDLARLSAQVQSVETRLLDQEEANEDIRALLVSLNAKLDQLASNRSSEPEHRDNTSGQARAVAAETVREAVTQAVSDVTVVKAARAPKPPKRGKAKS